jgi:hypothetical protein
MALLYGRDERLTAKNVPAREVLGQNVGLLTRLGPTAPLTRSSARADFPITGSECGSTGKGDTGVSKHYRAVFAVPGGAQDRANPNFMGVASLGARHRHFL